jgi:hypothetical protein
MRAKTNGTMHAPSALACNAGAGAARARDRRHRLQRLVDSKTQSDNAKLRRLQQHLPRRQVCSGGSRKTNGQSKETLGAPVTRDGDDASVVGRIARRAETTWRITRARLARLARLARRSLTPPHADATVIF